MKQNVIPEISSILTKLFSSSQNLTTNIFNSVPTGISIATDVTCKEILHNPKAAEFLRIEPWENFAYKAGANQPVRMYHNGRELAPEELPIERAARKGEEVKSFEIDFVWDDGVRKTSVWSASPLFSESGSISGAIATFENITERKRAEEALKGAAQLAEKHYYELNAVIEAFSDGLIIYDKKGYILFINEYLIKLFASINDDCSLKNRLNIFQPLNIKGEKINLEETPVNRSLNGEVVKDYELVFNTKTGEIVYISVSSTPIRDSSGQITGAVATYKDITKYKLAEVVLKRDQQQLEELVQERTRELEKSNLRINYILESIKDPFIAMDSQWRYIYMNPQAKEEYSDFGDLIGKNIWNVFPKLVNTIFWEKYHEVMNRKKPLVFEAKTIYKCTGYWFEFSVYPFGEGISVLFRDITRRKLAEEALRQSEERFNKTFESSPLFMSVYSLDRDEFIAVNSNFSKIYGSPKEEIIGHSTSDINIWVSEEERSKFMEEIKRTGYANSHEINFRLKSGDIVTMLVSGVITQIDVESCVISTGIDISELRNLQKEMARLDRLHLVGEMAAGIGHEVRNPMTTIKGFLQLLREKERYAGDKDYFDLMVDELDRANSIISEFLSLAKNKAVELKIQSLNKILKSILPLIAADGLVTDKYIELKTQKIPDLMLDEKEVRQLVLNLVRNGLEAMSPGGSITIRTYTEEDEIVLAVRDSGKGIPPKVLEKLGTPFFTTKDNGTGLGLAVCYSIAARHNARIEVETGSEGTAFFVRFR